VHNVTTHWTDQGLWIDLDLEVDPSLSIERAHGQATSLETKLREELMKTDASMPVAGINAHIEPRPEDSEIGAPLEPVDARRYADRVSAIALEFQQCCGCHDIHLHSVHNKVYLSFHMLVRVGASIAEVHAIAEQLESRLRREFPELGRVVIHTEPAIGN
jgi:divalent metal cation (Fe/Co/Zn/Cd) transporter